MRPLLYRRLQTPRIGFLNDQGIETRAMPRQPEFDDHLFLDLVPDFHLMFGENHLQGAYRELLGHTGAAEQL